jgi:hypothetical protein
VSDLVARLAAQAVNERSSEILLAAFVAAARFATSAERAGDVRDGLIAMPLPFHAAERLGVDADAVVAEAVDQLDPDEEALLHAFAGRSDRADVAAMNWNVPAEGTLSYRFHG